MSYGSRYAAAGLGQAKDGRRQGEDRTASDWTAGLTALGPLVTGIVGAATNQPAATAAPGPEESPASSAPASAGPSWYWPVIIGVGVAVLGGIGYMSYSVKAPIKANRRRSRRRSSRRRSRRMSPNGFRSVEDVRAHARSTSEGASTVAQHAAAERAHDQAVLALRERSGGASVPSAMTRAAIKTHLAAAQRHSRQVERLQSSHMSSNRLR